MGNTTSIQSSALIIQRMITPDIYIGIKSTEGKQALKLKNEYYLLEGYQEYPEKIIFQFEGQHFLEFTRGLGDNIHYTLTSPNEKQIGQVNDTIRKFYKKISMNSDELDKIQRLFQS
jgi:hypothetical protein